MCIIVYLGQLCTKQLSQDLKCLHFFIYFTQKIKITIRDRRVGENE